MMWCFLARWIWIVENITSVLGWFFMGRREYFATIVHITEYLSLCEQISIYMVLLLCTNSFTIYIYIVNFYAKIIFKKQRDQHLRQGQFCIFQETCHSKGCCVMPDIYLRVVSVWELMMEIAKQTQYMWHKLQVTKCDLQYVFRSWHQYDAKFIMAITSYCWMGFTSSLGMIAKLFSFVKQLFCTC